ncbi:DUF1657 domain-containing protein [Lederbergia wuyishanensis]|uniref:DUF1657 domain-containing protein n=1 Tax=Lederbergia wuyishanensis TaxID=1347903 RepID=A0ABU0D0M1_9BACI|nr:DUF1657 domain-containing protein [Lederbergia wuyishanensis]MCJ8006559.1 DUF1657 domain-containing protein [Lederbergia wuyishanensis]MDQ0341938.1 hypothetical protein [Lederbergia wuyishanensis]
MTVFSNVKATLASAKSIQSEFSRLAQMTKDPKASAIFHDCMMEIDDVIHDLQKRVEFMKAEELQYRNS